MSADKTDRGYDKTLPEAPAANARADLTRVNEDLTTKGATEALTRLYEEADPAKGLKSIASDQNAQTQYRTELARQLTDSNVLPALSIAHVRGLGDAVKTDGAVDPGKVIKRMQEERDPVRKALLAGFVSQYDQLKADSPHVRGRGREVTDDVLKKKVDDTTAAARANNELTAKRTKDRTELGDLVRNTDLFNSIAGSDGQITKADAEKFKERIERGTKPEDQELRTKFGNTPEAFERLKKTTDALIASFDNPKNKPGEPGSMMKDGSIFYRGGGSKDYMTQESLAKAMGFDNVTDGQAKLKDGPRPIAGVEPVTSYDQTRLRPGMGPQDLAHRMLDPTKEQPHFKDRAALDQARRDLEYVFRKGGPILQDKGGPEVTAANREQIIKEIQAREKANAERDKKPVDNTLSNWFASKYPEIKGTPTPAGPTVEATTDYKNSGVGRRGSWGVTENVTQGANLPADSKEAFRKILNNKALTGVDIASAPEGTPVIKPENLEKIRTAVEATKNEALIRWFNARYKKG